MPSYRYQNGDRPLDGFTIEQALGRGGFGEVYYAVSDSGRQVALKAVQNYEDIELRGISHCMNLKSPHLVSIFDVKHSERGDPFVIMEYVAGPSLRDLLDDAPNGLGPEKAAWFIREIAKGLALLHDNGVVHRDLKPHNVFFEDGYVKVGDYSLSKVITASHRSGHTLTVGTVHYMAPEIGVGRYDRTVDIYALGVLLFEMLTGQPPFIGETMGEVLMKHMAGDIDTSALDEPYASVVRKAMAKDPSERYQSVDELVADLFGNATVADGVSTFSPNSLTMVARRAAAGAERTRGSSSSTPTGRAAAARYQSNNQPHLAPRPSQRNSDYVDSTPYQLGRLWARLGAAFCIARARYADRPARSDDPIPRARRLTLAAIVILTMAWISNAQTKSWGYRVDEFFDEDLWGQAFLIAAIAGAAILGSRLVPSRQTWALRTVGWIGVVVPAFIAAGIINKLLRPFGGFEETVVGVVFPLIVMDWRWLTARSRPGRIRLLPCLTAAFCSYIVCVIIDGQPLSAAAMVGGAALAVQTLSEFDPVSSRRLLETVKWLTSLRETLGAWYGVRFPDIAAELRALDRPQQDNSARQSLNPAAFDGDAQSDSGNAVTIARSSKVWTSDESSPAVVTYSDAASQEPHAAASSDATELPSEAPSQFAALVLCLLPFVTFGFLPICGLHRFVSGRVISGFLWLFTLGLAGVGQLVDLILIALGEFRDAQGQPLRSRGSSEAVNGLSSVPATSMVSNGLAVLGGLVLAAAVMVGFVLAIDVPEMIAADVFRGFDLTGSDLMAIFGTKLWPELLRELLQLLAGILAVIATGLLIASRRTSGVGHLLKVPMAMVPFGITFGVMFETFFRVKWSAVADGIQQEKVGLILEEFLWRNDFVPCCIGAAVAFTVGLLILALPPRHTTIPAAAQQVPVKQEV